MKTSFTIISYLLVLCAITIPASTSNVTVNQSTIQTGIDATTDMSNLQVTRNLTSMPLAFTENRGQWDEKVLYRANAGGATMWFTTDGAYYQFTRRIPVGQDACRPDAVVKTTGVLTYQPHIDPVDRNPRGFDSYTDSIETMMIKASFIGANPNPQMRGVEMMEYKCNYFIGNDPDKWRTDVPNYESIVYENIYSGIDLKYYGNGKQMEYDFIVSPGADLSQIRIQYENIRSLSVNTAGELMVETDWNTVTEARPFVYQEDILGRREVAGRYRLLGNGIFGFELGNDYDPSKAIVIDPTLEYSTYLGGSDSDRGYGIAVDVEGCVYVTGQTESSDFPTENPFQTDQGYWDAFVTKLSSSGNSLVYSTYLGGSDDDYGYGIALDADGCAYVTGQTESSDFPTQNPFQMHQGFTDVFITKLSSSGNSLDYSTYLGAGSGHDYGYGIAIDAAGCAYVTGYSGSPDFPIKNPFQTDQGGYDAFVSKLNSSGDSLVYSSYLGGSDHDYGRGIAVDAAGCAYVTGEVSSFDFPTQNPFQTFQGNWDAFVTKLSNSGNSLVYSTYLGGNLGGSGIDRGYAIAVDAEGFAYVTGVTYSSDFPTQNPFQTDQGSGDAFVTKLSNGGNSLVYSTYLGGSSSDYGLAIAVDAAGYAHVTGTTLSSNFPTKNPFQTYQGLGDVFVTKLSGDGNSLVYSTYLGGSSNDYGRGIAVNATGCSYVTGQTYSSNFPTQNEFQTHQGDWDAFVTKLFVSCCMIRGDIDHDGQDINIADLVYLVNYMFNSGPPPPCPEEADIDGSGTGPDIADLVYLVNYMFNGGPPPVPCP